MDDEISIGQLFEQLEVIRTVSLQAAKKTTGFYEKDIATELHDLGDVVSDILYLLREHLSCHDCVVVDHTHDLDDGRSGRIYRVFAHDMKGGETGGSQSNGDAP